MPNGVKKACIEPPRPRLNPACAAEDLGQRAVDQEVDGQILDRPVVLLLDDRQAFAAHEVLHDVHQGVVVELADGRHALGQDLAVRAVRAEDVVVDVQQEGLPHRGGLLADRQVRRPLVVVLDALVARPRS